MPRPNHSGTGRPQNSQNQNQQCQDQTIKGQVQTSQFKWLRPRPTTEDEEKRQGNINRALLIAKNSHIEKKQLSFYSQQTPTIFLLPISPTFNFFIHF